MPSGNRGLNLFLAILVLALGIGKVRGASEPPPAPASSAPSQAEAENDASEPAKSEAPKGEWPPDPCRGGQDLLARYRALYQSGANAGTFRFLLALLPDPEESGHTDYFDAVFEGVEDAVGAGAKSSWKSGDTKVRHYVRDRHFLPWPGSSAEGRKQRCWETTPGVVL